MTEAYTGGCACGGIRYTVSADPVSMSECQCRQCQRGSGTGHGSYLTFVGAPVELVGAASGWESVGEGGTRKKRAFCPNCGSPTHLTFPDMPEVFVAIAASLDDPSRYRPQKVMWASAGQPWDRHDPALPKYEKMPPRSE